MNLDPANICIPYEPDIDVAGLIALERVMSELDLGPNGGLIYCLEYLEKNLDWLVEQLKTHSGTPYSSVPREQS